MTSPITKPSEALRAARDLITPEGAWTKETWARNNKHRMVPPDSPNAVCWCALGAIKRFDQTHVTDNASMEFLAKAVGDWPSDWNDAEGRDHAEVLDAFDRAIALAEEAGQ